MRWHTANRRRRTAQRRLYIVVWIMWQGRKIAKRRVRLGPSWRSYSQFFSMPPPARVEDLSAGVGR